MSFKMISHSSEYLLYFIIFIAYIKTNIKKQWHEKLGNFDSASIVF